MIVTLETEGYNHRRYSRPWIARVIAWPVGESRQELAFGAFVGRHGYAGQLEVEAEPGDLVRHGQKDYRNPRKSESHFAIVEEDGSLAGVSTVEARKHWLDGEDG